MRIAIVGGTGFVGGHVADVLIKAGHDVTLMDKNPPRWHPTAIYSKLDVTDRLDCLQAFSGYQVVMHLAAMSNTQMAINDPWLCTQLNCLGTVNVLDGARNAGVDRVVIAGSTLISGIQEVTGYTEDIDDPEKVHETVDESSPVEVLMSGHPYVTSKVFEEMIARDYEMQFGLECTVLRYGIQYGPRMTPGVVVHTFIERALQGLPLIVHGDGSQWRQYIHVQDVAEAHRAVIDQWDDSAATFNIVTPRKVTILDIAKAVSDVTGANVEFGPERPGDIKVKWCDSQYSEECLQWTPKISLADGIRSTVEWYGKHLSSGIPRKVRGK